MASHKHKWEILHEIYPPAAPQAVTIVDETGAERVVPFDPSYVEGTVGFEMDEPYRVEYCACGEKKVSELTQKDARDLAVRTGRIVEETLDLVGRSEASGA